MKRIVIYLFFCMKITLAQDELTAQFKGHGVGNGTGGIYATYKAAANFALWAIRIVKPETFEKNQELFDFYQKHRKLLRTDILRIIIDKERKYLQVREEVKAWIAGELKPVKAVTGNTPGSPILISREQYNGSEPLELKVFTLLHEIGHHTGWKDEDTEEALSAGEVKFLDFFAESILIAAKKKSENFFEQLRRPVVVQVNLGNWNFRLNHNNNAHVCAWFMINDQVNVHFSKVHRYFIKSMPVVKKRDRKELKMYVQWFDQGLVQVSKAKRVVSIEKTREILFHVLWNWKDEPIYVLFDIVDLLYSFRPESVSESDKEEGSLDVSDAIFNGIIPLYPMQREVLESEKARIKAIYGEKYADLLSKLSE